MQVFGPLPLSADPVGQRGGRSVIVQHEVQAVMGQEDSSHGVCELIGVRIGVISHRVVPVYGGTVFPVHER